MLINLNFNAYKIVSLVLVFVILFSCMTILSFDIENNIKLIDRGENLSSTDIATLYYEILIFQETVVQNRYRDRSSRENINDKIAIQLGFFASNNIDKFVNNTILKNASDMYITHDTILLYIHNKDGKKRLV